MQKNVSVLDCTLREAPIDGLMWGDMSIKKVITGLENAGVDIIEVGFLKDVPHVLGSTSFHTVEDIKPYLKNKKNGVIYTALVDYGRYDTSALTECDGTSVDAIRVCFKHQEIDKVLDYAQEFRDKGYKVCIQHVDTMGYTESEIIKFIKEVNIFKPLVYSIVDTFGAMYENDMLRLASLTNKHLDKSIALGFHGHNNLMLADANAQRYIQEFSEKRNIVVDSSLYGCGRSAGNAHTELLAQFMNQKIGTNYDINAILDLIDSVISLAREKTSWGYSIPYFIAGMHNAHTFNVKQLLKRHNLKSKDLRGIIELLDDDQKSAYNYALLEKLYVQYFDHPINDNDSILELSERLQNRDIVLLAPGKSVQEQRDEIEKYIDTHESIVIGVNNLIDNYHMDYVFFSSAIRYQNINYIRYNDVGSPKLIVTSNIKQSAGNNEIIVNYASLIKYGWVNIDSSIILLLKLLKKCKVKFVSIAGLDGLNDRTNNYYNDTLDTGLDDDARRELIKDNISMIRDILTDNPNFKIQFITKSIYSEAL